MLHRFKKILWEKNGFSGIQKLMMTVLAAAIVCVCAFAFYGYYQSSYQVKASRTAEQAYEAVSDYLSKQYQAGTLPEFNNRARYYGKSLGIELQRQILEANYTGADFEAYFEKYRKKYGNGEIRYLIMKSESTGEENREQNPLYEMFEYFILDQKNMRDAYLVEYDAATGRVFSVFYSRKAGELRYGGEWEDKENVVLRDTESLTKKWQGYYGLEPEELL